MLGKQGRVREPRPSPVRIALELLVDEGERNAQARQVGALRNYARLARLRYDNGYTSYLEVTDAETKLFNAELQYTQTQGQLFFALINLYKAMGGGWVNDADKLVPPPAVDISRTPPIFP